jgi:hypothetical protein
MEKRPIDRNEKEVESQTGSTFFLFIEFRESG